MYALEGLISAPRELAPQGGLELWQEVGSEGKWVSSEAQFTHPQNGDSWKIGPTASLSWINETQANQHATPDTSQCAWGRAAPRWDPSDPGGLAFCLSQPLSALMRSRPSKLENSPGIAGDLPPNEIRKL